MCTVYKRKNPTEAYPTSLKRHLSNTTLIGSARICARFKAIDAVYFNGSSADRALLTVGTARRPERRVNGFCALRVPQFSDRVLVNPQFPDTNLEQTEAEADDLSAYTVAGIQVRPQLAMRSWRLTYSGKMK